MLATVLLNQPLHPEVRPYMLLNSAGKHHIKATSPLKTCLFLCLLMIYLILTSHKYMKEIVYLYSYIQVFRVGVLAPKMAPQH